MPTGRRIGLALGAIAIFVFGVVVGRTSVGTQPTAASGTSPTTEHTSPIGGTDSTTSSPSALTRSPGPPPGSTVVEPTTTLPTSMSTTAPSGSDSGKPPWPTTVGSCHQEIPDPLIGRAAPLPTRPKLELITGGNPATVHVRSGTVGGALYHVGDSRYVADIATGRDTVVMLVASCSADDNDDRVVRVAIGDHPTTVDLPDGLTPTRLLAGGNRVWIQTSAGLGAYGSSPIMVVAADGSGDSVTLPTGFLPVGADGTDIIGTYGRGGMATAPIEVYDTTRGGIVQQFGAPGGAINAVVDGGYVIWSPWACEDSCDIQRLDLSTGEQHSAHLQPATDRILSSGAAISPDGGTAAVSLYGQPPSPRYAAPPLGPSGTGRIALIDLGDGTVTVLGGLVLGPARTPALTFSPDGQWLVVAIGAGDHTQLLLYAVDDAGPYDPDISLPGTVLVAPLVLSP